MISCLPRITYLSRVQTIDTLNSMKITERVHDYKHREKADCVSSVRLFFSGLH